MIVVCECYCHHYCNISTPLFEALVHCLALRLVTSSEGAEETEEDKKKVLIEYFLLVNNSFQFQHLCHINRILMFHLQSKDLGYRTSSKIEKRPTEDHPCNLTR